LAVFSELGVIPISIDAIIPKYLDIYLFR
jgi:hypothetical protein